MRLRVMQWITELGAAGAERVVYELATRLDPARFEVEVVSLTSPGGDDGLYARKLTEAGVPVRLLRLRHKRDVLRAPRLARWLRRFRPHVLHAHLAHANLAARALGRVCGAGAVASTVHVVERRRRPLRRALERVSAWRDDATFAVSDAAGAEARRLGARRVVVIPNGVNLAAFRPATTADRAEARRRLGLEPARWVVGCVGRLDRQKGFDLALDALASLPADATLIVAGRGPEDATLRQQAARWGDRVRWLGFREDVPEVLAACDVFAMPSRWEGFGLTAVEALAAGVPTVVTEVDSLPEVVADAAIRVAPEDPAALAAGLISARERAEALRVAGPERAARFGIERMVARYAEEYERLSR